MSFKHLGNSIDVVSLKRNEVRFQESWSDCGVTQLTCACCCWHCTVLPGAVQLLMPLGWIDWYANSAWLKLNCTTNSNKLSPLIRIINCQLWTFFALTHELPSLYSCYCFSVAQHLSVSNSISVRLKRSATHSTDEILSAVCLLFWSWNLLRFIPNQSQRVQYMTWPGSASMSTGVGRCENIDPSPHRLKRQRQQHCRQRVAPHDW